MSSNCRCEIAGSAVDASAAQQTLVKAHNRAASAPHPSATLGGGLLTSARAAVGALDVLESPTAEGALGACGALGTLGACGHKALAKNMGWQSPHELHCPAAPS